MNKKTISIISLILIPIVIGIALSPILITYLKYEPIIREENFTRFYVVNKSNISIEKPVSLERQISYRVIIENHENRTIKYKLNVLFGGNEIYNKSINLKNEKIFNRIISFRPNLTNNSNKYFKLEFRLYKNKEYYTSKAFQINIESEKKISEND